MVVTVAALQRRFADINRQTRVVWQRIEEREAAPVEQERRTALDIAADLGLVLDPWQREIVTTDSHHILVNVSRQGGKGTVATVLALDQIVNVPGSTVVVISRTERQAKRLFRRIRKSYLRLPNQPAPLVNTVTELELRNGSQSIALPGSEETVRGIDAVDLMIIDEASVVPDDIYMAVAPFLATTDGREALLSSARGKRGFFWRTYDMLGPWSVGTLKTPDWHRATVPAQLIPRIKASFLARQLRLMGGYFFRQEYGCEFLDAEDQFYATELIVAAVTSDLQPLLLPTLGAPE